MRVYNIACVPDRTITRAEEVASEIFRKAGVRVDWHGAPPDSPEAFREDASSQPRHPSPDRFSELNIRILAGVPLTIQPFTLGFARPFAAFGVRATVYHDRIEAVALQLNTSSEVLLGHAVAHELGHVLLGSVHHSSGSLMQASWTTDQMRRIGTYYLAFRPDEARLLQAEVGRQSVLAASVGLMREN